MIKEKKLNNQKGVTLVEMLIYMGILSVLLISLTEMFVSILNVKVDAEALSFVEQDAQFISLRIKYDVNRADSISTPVNPGDTSNTLVLSINSDTYTYQLNGTELELNSPLGTKNLNSNKTNVTGFSIRKVGPPSGDQTVKVEFDIESVAQTNTGPEEKSVKFSVGTR